MTNFEKILHDTPKEDMAEALSALFVGHCDDCPALALCDSLPEKEMHIGCRGVLLRWLNMEAEQEHEAAAEAYPKAEIIEINGETCLHVRTYPPRPEGGGGGFVYPMGNGGKGR